MSSSPTAERATTSADQRQEDLVKLNNHIYLSVCSLGFFLLSLAAIVSDSIVEKSSPKSIFFIIASVSIVFASNQIGKAVKKFLELLRR